MVEGAVDGLFSRRELSHNNLPPPPLGGNHPTYILSGFSAALAP